MSDPLKYFRIEAHDICEQLQSGVLGLERGAALTETVARLLRLAHTLKGAARVVKQLEIAGVAHRLEDLLAPLRGATRTLTSEETNELLAAVDAIAALVAGLGPAPALRLEAVEPRAVEPGRAASIPPPGADPLPAREDARRRVEDSPAPVSTPLEHVETLMDGVAELGFQLGSLRHAMPALRLCHGLAEQVSERLDPRRSRELGPGGLAALAALASDLEVRLNKLERETSTALERASRELGQVRDRVDQLRLIAAGTIFGSLERATRDAAMSLGKRATFEARGGDVRLDADVLTAVQRALIQAVRNAVAHGIEPDPERARSGKPSEGRIVLEVERRGPRIRFACRDDGRGVNLAEVQRQAERLGKVDGSAADKGRLLQMLLEGGISTSSQLTEVSGRGVGLDLIREALVSVGGSVALDTEPGRGTQLTLNVPASLAALEALLVEAAGEAMAVPLDCVVRALRVGRNELSRSAEQVALPHEGQLVPFVPLARLLRLPVEGARSPDQAWSVIIVRGRAGLLALGVDRLLGSESVVARSLPDSANLDEVVLGVTLDADGNPRLLLDPEQLLASATGLPPHAPDQPDRVRSILVIDDSLTTRMLEQSILESAGYRVTLATSAEQGLELAAQTTYDLFLVDVEMPGMDGFSFVAQTRADPQLSKTPAVLVTSRASAEDLARGRAAGASGHIAKGEFDQLEFLDKIAELMR